MISKELPALHPYSSNKLIGQHGIRSTLNTSVLWLSLPLIFHFMLGIVSPFFLSFSTYHAYFTIGLTFALALSGNKYLIHAAAYVVGAEIYWRMTGAGIFWESGKYTIGFALIIAITHRKSIKIPQTVFLFLLSLLPALLGIGSSFSLEELRNEVSFYGSGPFALFMCSVYFFQMPLSKQELVKILYAMILPLLTIGSYSLLGILTTKIEWGTESNVSSSGGYGPNQVSTVLGLGILIIFLMVILRKEPKYQRILLIALGLWFTIQTLFTFSRGGFYATVLTGIAFAVFVLRKSPKQLLSILLWGGVFYIVLLYAIMPQLNTVTNNKISSRFQNTSSTGRIEVAMVEIQAFIDNPLGGGAGSLNAIRGRSIGTSNLASHNEYTRLLAEHGILGIVALVCLLAGLYINFRNLEHLPMMQAIVGALIVWSLATLGHSAFRVAAPAYILGLTFASYNDEVNEDTVV